MAFSVKIKAMGPGFGENNIAFELPWWPENELMKDERFVVSNDTGSYFDYDAELTVEETRELYEKYKQCGLEGIYDGEGWQARIQPIMQALERALYERPEDYPVFTVTVFQWESGL